MKPLGSPVIETKRLVLRLVEKDDLPALFSVNGDDEVTRYLPYGSWKTPADGAAWFERARERHASGEAMQFAITLRDSGRAVGTMLLFRFDEPTGRAEVGYVLARELWGKGLMKEALDAFIVFAFERVGLKRLEAQLDPRNAASAKLLERAGFVKEGHQRRNFFAKGELADTGLYGLLREDRGRF